MDGGGDGVKPAGRCRTARGAVARRVAVALLLLRHCDVFGLWHPTLVPRERAGAGFGVVIASIVAGIVNRGRTQEGSSPRGSCGPRAPRAF